MEQEVYRHVPYDIEVEQALLGSILVDNRALEAVSALLRAEQFYDPLHQRLYETMLQSHERGGMVLTPLTLHAAMKADPGLVEVGGHAYLVGLAQAAPALPNVRDYARILHDLAVRRSLIRIGEDIVNTAYEAPHDRPPQSQIEEAEKALYRVSETSQIRRRSARFRREPAPRGGKLRNGRRRAAAGSRASRPGFTDIDSLLGGLQPSDLLILAGRPGMGKTSLAHQHGVPRRARLRAGHGGGRGVAARRAGAVLLARNGGAAIVGAYSVRADRNRDVENPQRQVLGQRVGEVRSHHAGPEHAAALHRRHRRHLHRPDRRARAAAEAREEDRPHHHRLSPAGRAVAPAPKTACRKSPRSPRA